MINRAKAKDVKAADTPAWTLLWRGEWGTQASQSLPFQDKALILGVARLLTGILYPVTLLDDILSYLWPLRRH